MAITPTLSQPQETWLTFQLTKIDIISLASATPPTDVVDAGEQITFRIQGEVTGNTIPVVLLAKLPVSLKVHVEEMESPGTRKTFDTPTASWIATTSGLTGSKVLLDFTSPAITTGLYGSGMDLTTAPNDDDAIYRVSVQAHFQVAKSIVAFGEGLLAVTRTP